MAHDNSDNEDNFNYSSSRDKRNRVNSKPAPKKNKQRNRHPFLSQLKKRATNQQSIPITQDKPQKPIRKISADELELMRLLEKYYQDHESIKEQRAKTTEVKKFTGKINRHGETTVYTDGSCKASEKTDDRRSFSGWGYHSVSKDSDGNKVNTSKFGSMINSNSSEAELRSVLSAIKDQSEPTNLTIVTDCKRLITDGFSCLEDKISEFHRILDKEKSGSMTPQDKERYFLLKMWNEIYLEVMRNDNIISMSVHWTKSHVLENATKDDFLSKIRDRDINIDFIRNNELRSFCEDVIGNYRADLVANRGVEEGIDKCLSIVFNTENRDGERYQQALHLLRKNHEKSRFVLNYIVNYIGKDSSIEINNGTLRSLLSRESRVLCQKARDYYCMGLTQQQVMSAIASNGVFDFNTSVDIKSLIRNANKDNAFEENCGLAI